MKRRAALGALLTLGTAGPLRTHAQSGQVRRVALFLAGTATAVARQRTVIVERLASHGFIEGRNLRVDVRLGNFNRGFDANVARELVAPRPDAILVDTTPLAMRTREASETIPIVFMGVADPIRAGLVKDFARPGRNATGIHFSQPEIGAKRLELLRELVPGARRVMVARELAGPEFDTLPHVRQAAARLGFEIIEIGISWIHGLAPVTDAPAHERPEAIIAGQPWAIYGMEWVADQIIRFAAERRIPALFWEAAMADRGATIAYGVDPARELGRAADQLARVLKGAKPADLSVDQSTHYELVVNKKAAQALGIAIPASILARADRIIE